MRAVYCNPGALEAAAKERFCFPDFVMMENAAAALEKKFLKCWKINIHQLKIPCC